MAIDLNVFWAKSRDQGVEYSSLIQHSRDIGNVINTVSHSLLSPATKQFLEDSLGEAPLSGVLTLAALSHDCGKLSSFFQRKIPLLSQRASRAGFDSDVTPKEMTANPHSIISAHTLTLWLEKFKGSPVRGITKNFWFSIIAGHHGTFSEIAPLSDAQAREIRRYPEWLEARFQLIDTLAEEFGLDDDLLKKLSCLFDDADDGIDIMAAAALITGILISADWVASNEWNFPYTNGETQIQERRLKNAQRSFNLGKKWIPHPVDEDSFLQRFNLPKSATLRNVQRAVIDVAHTQAKPSFTILENETGSGKTEAALTLAEITAAKLGFDGLFFAQPTRVTSDAIFSRVAEWLHQAPSENSVSTVLAHGKAEFNDEFQEITSSGFTEIYDDENEKSGTQLEATQWFQGKKTGLLASIVVGTIDQALYAVLQSKHNVLRHLGLAGKVVIIDEIHAADAYMRVYLTRLLEWLGLYGVPVIALSATLPPVTRRELIAAYHAGATVYDGSEPDLDDSPVYPRITWTDGATTQTVAPEHDGLNRTTFAAFAGGDLDEMAHKALSLAEDGGCIGIICSTVNRAQRLYQLIEEQEENTVLLHSRFLTHDRVVMEADLVSQLGRRAGDTRPVRLIVVSTQIIEQGLDLDFDAMITDIAPTDLIIQRIGRLHRHASLNPARPEALKKPTLTIFGAGIPNTTGPAPNIQMGSQRVYRKAPLLRSIRVLADHLNASEGRITTPVHVENLVSASYDENFTPPEEWSTAWGKALDQERSFEKQQRDAAALSRIPDPSSEDLAGWSRQPSPADEQSSAAQVRDADESFEVVVVRNDNGRVYGLPHVREIEGYPLDGIGELDWDIAKAVARCTVRLPGWALSNDDLMDLEADGQESWQKSRWLRGSLPLVLDSNLSREVDDYVFRYDTQLGLLMERKEK